MKRNSVRVSLVALLVAAAWAIGRAQAPFWSNPADFELAVTTQGDRTIFTCVRGCSLTWEPSVAPDGQREMHIPSDTTFCNSPAKSCKLLGWKR
jgi:hypothetical protein